MKVLFVGNRASVLKKLLEHGGVEVVKAIVIEQPQIKDNSEVEIVRLKSSGEKSRLLSEIEKTDYDLFISGGCSYILPISSFPEDKIYLNCHPSLLPYGKGIHPLNECFNVGRGKTGVSIHILTDELDAGDIVKQREIPLSKDVDLSLLYGFVFDLEAELLIDAVDDLINNHFEIYPQKGKGSYYSRPKEQAVFSCETRCSDFLNYVAGNSSSNLGAFLDVGDSIYKVFMAREVTNSFICSRYIDSTPGMIFENSDVVLVKLYDGYIRLDRFEKVLKRTLL
jgi:methionyl-tRNA formyltransferase